MRQKEDEDFQNILQMVRKCLVDADMKVVDFIKQHCRDVAPAHWVNLFISNQRARDANREAIDCVNGLSQVFPAVDYPARNANAVAALNFVTNLPERLFVKVGARVMVVRNLDVECGWSNGALA